MPHGVPPVVVFLSRLAGILALSKIARIFAIRVRVMTVGVTLERRTVCAFGAAEAGRLRSVAKARAEMIFDIDHSLGERLLSSR